MEEQDRRLEELQDDLVSSDSDPQHLFEKCYQAGFTPIALGSARLGVRISEQEVVKVAWKESGIISNLIEDKIWSSASEHLKSFLAPVTYITPEKHVLYQDFVLPIAASIVDPEVQNMIGILSAYGIIDIVNNLGMYQQRIVCYDYAMIRPEEYPRLFPEVIYK